MIPLVVMGWIHLVFMLVLLNIYEIHLKLKFEFRIIHKFSRVHLSISDRAESQKYLEAFDI
jgi:hypothetical protein